MKNTLQTAALAAGQGTAATARTAALHIVKDGEKWKLFSKDGKKLLGTFDSEAEAKKHEQQIEFFKQQGAAAAARASDTSAQTVALRQMAAFAGGGVEVDEKAGVIRNCAIMTIGQPRGFPWEADATTISQLKAIIDAAPEGLLARFKHPQPAVAGEPLPETLGTDVGYVKNARIEGDSVRGDVYLGDYAEVLPGLGNVRAYLLAKAKSDPAGMGLSAVIVFRLEDRGDGELPVARLLDAQAVDFVGTPAANPNGLLSAQISLPNNPTPDAGAKLRRRQPESDPWIPNSSNT